MTDDSFTPPSEGRPGGERAPAAEGGATRRSSQGALAGADLSREIEQAVSREPGDQVRCTRVTGDQYRCNWWSVRTTSGYDNPAMKGGQLATDHRIRKSQFLRVTKGRTGLNIVGLSAG